MKTMTQNELKELLKALEAKAQAQAPYFDDRLLSKIEQVKALLVGGEA